MQISGLATALTQGYNLSNHKKTEQETSAELFQGALNQEKSSTPDKESSSAVSSAPPDSKAAKKPDATEKFLKYMDQSPAEQMQAAWLAQHGITKEEFDKMDPKDKEKLVQKMEQEIKEKMAAELSKPQYKPVNILV